MITKEICRSCSIENKWEEECGFNEEYAFYEPKMTDCVSIGEEGSRFYLCKKHVEKMVTFYTNLRKEFDDTIQDSK